MNYRSLSHQKYKINPDKFSKIDNHISAYWLGFLYADGNLHEKQGSYVLGLALKDNDVNHIYKFLDYIESDHPVYDYNYTNCKEVRIRNYDLGINLLNLGVIPVKSLTLTFPKEDQVPKYFINSFILGYFDGDGCIHIRKSRNNQSCLTFLGTNMFLSKCKQLLNDSLDLTSSGTLGKEGNISTLKFYRKSDITKIQRWLYKDCPVFLSRKKNLFKEIEEMEL